MPRLINVVSLLGPLEPHSNPILEESRNKTEARHVRQHMFAISKDLIGEILSLADVLAISRGRLLFRHLHLNTARTNNGCAKKGLQSRP